jgi:type IV fimbrial biogenesis protein FimT
VNRRSSFARRGFTLIEMMMTLLILGVLGTMAFSFSGQFTRQNRVSMQSNELVADLALARTQAAASGQFTTVCTSTSGTGCTSSNWQAGYIVFLDRNGDGVVNVSTPAQPTDDRVLRVTPALTGNNTMAGTNLVNTNRVQYRPDGLLADFTMGSNPRMWFRIVAGDRASCYREVWVDTSGRPYVPTAAQLQTAGRSASQC